MTDPHATPDRAATAAVFAYLDVAVTAINRAKDGAYRHAGGADALRSLQEAEKAIYDVMEAVR